MGAAKAATPDVSAKASMMGAAKLEVAHHPPAEASARAAAKATVYIPAKASMMVCCQRLSRSARGPPRPVRDHAAAEDTADIHPKASTMCAAEAEVAPDPPAKASARAAIEAIIAVISP